MFAPSIAAFLMLLLAGTSATAQTCPPPGEAEGRCIELTADGTNEVSEVQISPGQPTTFSFDSDVRADGMTLENRERFKVAPGQRLITLEPSEKMRGEKLSTLTVCFADGEVPPCMTFRLVVHPAIGERRVEIFRHSRPVESIQADLKKSYEENARLRAEIQRLRAERDNPDGLTGLLASGMMSEKGIPCSTVRVVQRPGNALSARGVTTCRARRRMAVRFDLRNEGTAPWTAQGAKLVGPKGEELEGSVWPQKPVLLGEPLTLYIEVRAEDVRTTGPFVLKLWQANGLSTVTLGSVTFPALTEGPGL
ncbi:uncharacterized protein (TIGR02268 family) [Archangium gephyra]|uniref:Uncharacterized protein (TIGR02268 family) n=1 Tax=Archangium gephyra TaxID=48 RepID=A0ABX9JSD1_9BACT|nr:DUF2381 family protein [Archangium gephyra]REG26130.1 uncharacterized protein (TIGR02268 family) [Archangium gephyra]